MSLFHLSNCCSKTKLFVPDWVWKNYRNVLKVFILNTCVYLWMNFLEGFSWENTSNYKSEKVSRCWLKSIIRVSLDCWNNFHPFYTLLNCVQLYSQKNWNLGKIVDKHVILAHYQIPRKPFRIKKIKNEMSLWKFQNPKWIQLKITKQKTKLHKSLRLCWLFQVTLILYMTFLSLN